MLPGMELMGCTNLAVPAEVMHHVVRVESSYNPYAIGVVGGRLARQPRNLPEAVATAQMLESRGYNFSLGLAQVNRYNLRKYGLDTYERAFGKCANLTAGASILAECHSRSKGDWGNAFSCYYSGNFVTGYRHGYVQKVFASMGSPTDSTARPVAPIGVIARAPAVSGTTTMAANPTLRDATPIRRNLNPLVALRSGSAVVSRAESVRESVADTEPGVAAVPSASAVIAETAGAPQSAGVNAPRLPASDTSAKPGATAVQQNEALSDSAFVF